MDGEQLGRAVVGLAMGYFLTQMFGLVMLYLLPVLLLVAVLDHLQGRGYTDPTDYGAVVVGVLVALGL